MFGIGAAVIIFLYMAWKRTYKKKENKENEQQEQNKYHDNDDQEVIPYN